MAYNADFTGEKYREIARAFHVEDVDSMSPAAYREAAIKAVRQLARDVEIPHKLSKLGVKKEHLQFLTDSAFADVCTPGNPRKATKEDIFKLYEEAF